LILTLTVNPAVDKNVTADHLVFEDRAYILARSESAGGRESTPRCDSFIGGATAAIVPRGGRPACASSSCSPGVVFRFTWSESKSNIRTNLTISDKTGLTVKLNELGPPMTRPEVSRLEAMVGERLDGASWLLICGSLPPAVAPSLYSRLVAMARERGVKTLLDTDGEPLREGSRRGRPWWPPTSRRRRGS